MIPTKSKKMFAFVVYLLVIIAIFEQETSALEHGILTVKKSTAVEENESEHFCIAYNLDNTTLPKENSFHTLLDLSSSTLCKDPPQSEIIEGKVVIVKNGNCSLLQKSLIAQKYGADSIIISVNGSQNMKFNGSEELKISVAIILDDDVKLIKKVGENVVASLSAPDQPILDYNMALIWIMATGTAIGGALWGGTTAHKAVLRKKNKQRRRTETEENEETNKDDKDSDDSMPITSMVVVIWVFMIVIVLLLMFFLYDYFVYVIIALYCLGAVNGLYICLSPIILVMFPFKTRIVCCNAPDKLRPLVVSVVLIAVCTSFVAIWFCFRHADFAWILLDIMGIAFCISILKTIRLSNFKTCFLLLSLLFFYDIFMVFVTPYITKSGESIMVEVATGSGGTKEQIPVLLQVPHLSTSVYSVCYRTAYSMLGFGDILIPGLLISHCYAFDLKVNSKRIYLISTSIAYGTGLLITFAALAIMQMGQPALLYLVPTTVGTALTVAKIRGEVRHLWNGSLDKKDEGDTVDAGSVTSGSASRLAEEGNVTCHKRNNGSNESLEPLMESEVVN